MAVGLFCNSSDHFFSIETWAKAPLALTVPVLFTLQPSNNRARIGGYYNVWDSRSREPVHRSGITVEHATEAYQANEWRTREPWPLQWGPNAELCLLRTLKMMCIPLYTRRGFKGLPGALPMMQGASSVSLQYRPDALMAFPQQSWSLRPAAAAAAPHPEPPHWVQPGVQQTTPLPSTPIVPSRHCSSALVTGGKHKFHSARNKSISHRLIVVHPENRSHRRRGAWRQNKIPSQSLHCQNCRSLLVCIETMRRPCIPPTKATGDVF